MQGGLRGSPGHGPAMVVNRCPKPQSWTWSKEAPAVFLAPLLTDVDKPLSLCFGRLFSFLPVQAALGSGCCLHPVRGQAAGGGCSTNRCWGGGLASSPASPIPFGPVSPVLPQAAAQGQGAAAAFPPAPPAPRPRPESGPLRSLPAAPPGGSRGRATAPGWCNHREWEHRGFPAVKNTGNSKKTAKCEASVAGDEMRLGTLMQKVLCKGPCMSPGSVQR